MKLAITALHKDHLEYSRLADIHLALYHVIHGDPSGDVLAFYRQEKAKGKYTILDNGAAEGEHPSPDMLYKLAMDNRDMTADSPEYREESARTAATVRGTFDVVIAPDTLNDAAETLVATHEFLDAHYYMLHREGVKVMGVAQGDTYESFLTCLNIMREDSRIDIIGMPKCMDSIKPFESRWGLIQYLNQCDYFSKGRAHRYHLLGMSKWVGEVAAQHPVGFDSMDTSYPIINSQSGMHDSFQVMDLRYPHRQYEAGRHVDGATVIHNIFQLMGWMKQ